FYRDAFKLVDELKPQGLEIFHCFQTNGTLINEAWCDFFLDAHVNLGVSIDGPKRFHDLNRLTRSGRGTFDKVIAGVRLLRKREVPFHTISVLSMEAMREPREMYDFFMSEGIEYVCFNAEESEGDHGSNVLGDSS